MMGFCGMCMQLQQQQKKAAKRGLQMQPMQPPWILPCGDSAVFVPPTVVFVVE